MSCQSRGSPRTFSCSRGNARAQALQLAVPEPDWVVVVRLDVIGDAGRRRLCLLLSKQQRHLPNWPLRAKNRALATNPANMVQQLTKLHNNAAWHRRARFQLQREPLCAQFLSSHDFCARPPTRQIMLLKQHESLWNIPARCLTKTKRSITWRDLPVRLL